MPIKKSKKGLEMVKKTNAAAALFADSIATPHDVLTKKGLQKMTRPTLLKIDAIPVGVAVSGEILALVQSLSPRKDMKDAKLIHMRNYNNPDRPVDFLLPATGVIKAALGDHEGIEKATGRTLYVVRNPDGETAKYGGKKKVYMFDVYLDDK